MISFSKSVCEKIDYYVYLLKDSGVPGLDGYFYVGKGTGNRVFAHVCQALESPNETDKLDTIRAIQAAGRRVEHVVLRHGLTEETAFEIESAVIDLLKCGGNVCKGHYADTRGMMSDADLEGLYCAEKAEIAEPCLLIVLNRRYERAMSGDSLYEATRGSWVIGTRRNKAKYAMAVYRGLVREVYEVYSWSPVERTLEDGRKQTRWVFEGRVAEGPRKYVGKDVSDYLGAQNPIRYVNC